MVPLFSLTIEPPGVVLLRPDWVMIAKSAKNGKVPPHEVSWRSSVQFPIWENKELTVLAWEHRLWVVVQEVNSWALFLGLSSTGKNPESWEITDSDSRDEHQGCEIDITTVGRAEREKRGKEERLEGPMRRERTEVW